MSWVVSEVHGDCVTSFMTASLKCFPCSIPHIQLQPDGSAKVVAQRYVEEPNAAKPRTTKTSPLLVQTQGKSRRLSRGIKNTDQKLQIQILHGSGFYCGCLKTWSWRLFAWKYLHTSLSFTHTLQHSTPPALPSIIETRVLVCTPWAPLI